MKPVVKITLRKSWHTSVQYLSCVFSFPLPITTAFMNHFYPSPIAPYHSLSPYFLPQHSWSRFLYNILSTLSFVTIRVFSFTIRFFLFLLHLFLLSPSLHPFFSSYSISFNFFHIIFPITCFLPPNFLPFFYHYLFLCNRLHYHVFIQPSSSSSLSYTAPSLIVVQYVSSFSFILLLFSLPFPLFSSFNYQNS